VLDLERGLALDDLRERVRKYEIETGFDSRLIMLKRRIGPALELANADHRAAVLAWLRQWGCRHLNRASEAISAAVLLAWSQKWVPHLPGPLGRSPNFPPTTSSQ
jgi:hypothetical protein